MQNLQWAEAVSFAKNVEEYMRAVKTEWKHSKTDPEAIAQKAVSMEVGERFSMPHLSDSVGQRKIQTELWWLEKRCNLFSVIFVLC